MANNNENLRKVADKLAPNQSKVQLILAGVAAIALALRTQHVPSMNVCLILSLSSLAVLLFFSAFASPPAETTIVELLVTKLFGYGSAVAIMGILFTLQNFKGTPRLVFAGCGVLLLGIIVKLMKKDVKVNMTKQVLILIIALALYFTPKEKLVQMNIVHDHPVALSTSTTGN